MPRVWSDISFTAALHPRKSAAGSALIGGSRFSRGFGAIDRRGLEARKFLRHRIESALRERTAAQQPLDGEHAAAPRAVARDGFIRVIRAGRIKLAGAAEKRREQHHVQPDEKSSAHAARRICARRYSARLFRRCGAAALSSSARQRRKLRRRRRAARMNHDVPSRGDLLSVQSKNFAEPAADAVAPDRAAQRLFDAPAEPAEIEAIGAKKNRELAARPPAAFAIHRVVFGAAQQAAGAGKIEPRRIRRA